jgi:hypothetical protein
MNEISFLEKKLEIRIGESNRGPKTIGQTRIN